MDQTTEELASSEINSKEYWDQRFAQDWEIKHGREQSRFFSRLALKYFPDWLQQFIKAESLSICDWGCAQGDGTALLAEHFGFESVTGVDFSPEAIERACKAYPQSRFTCEDFLVSRSGSQYDVLFSSNTLEHFTDPWRILEQVSARARNFLVLLLPFREYERIDEHFSTIDFASIPAAFGEWTLMQSVVINAAAEHPNYWNGEQVLLVYGRADQISKFNLSLADAVPQISNIDMLLERDTALNDRDTARTERDAALAERDALKAERDRVLAERNAMAEERNAAMARQAAAQAALVDVWNSNSWRITRPVRFGTKLLRHGFAEEDRQKLSQELRMIYQRLPLPPRVKDKIRWTYRNVVQRTFRTVNRQITAIAEFQPPAIQPAAATPSAPDYVVWGVIDWHFRHQRPQQLAQALAQSGRRVFYVSVNLKDDERRGFEVEALDAEGRLFQVTLYAKGAPVIYSNAPTAETVSQLRASIGELLQWSDSKKIVSLVQHPFWHAVATVLPNSRVVYDCMDHHEGFGNTATEILTLERTLLREADLTVTTSGWLDDIVSEHTSHRAVIRNAADFRHFSQRPADMYRDPQGRRIIGYYGAIAEWFDLDLVEAVAKRFSECCILLIGADTVHAQQRLGKLPNIKFIGEVPYARLPYYLYGFDVCLLPFKVIPLTLATNPVKVYEYLSASKPVVSVDLPEIKQFGDLVRVGDSADAFLAQIEFVLDHSDTPEELSRRQSFAKEQTWGHRVSDLIASTEHIGNDPAISIIVVTYNNLHLTRECLLSLDKNTNYDPLEIIVVDNASADGTQEFLSQWVAGAANRKIILNEKNLGFAAANNQGLAIANGDYLVLLNNDTYVTPGWLRTLTRHLHRDKSIGLIGPVTNNIGNEAKIHISYANMDEMIASAARYTRRHIGQTLPLRTAAFFCVMMSREIYERVGPLDEVFGRGFFEDDDYCRRVEQLGRRIVCAEDVFVHHHLSASFNKLKVQERQALFEQNKAVYEAKWGKWVPHNFRKDESA